jgi:predicted phage terminase large subunit-like protein
MRDEMIIQSWDTAIKSGKQHDASVCLTFRFRGGIHYLLDAAVLRLEYPDLKRAVSRLAACFSPDAILIEDKASGQSILQDVRREGVLPLIAIQPKNDKITRVARITPMLEAGLVALPHVAPWLAAFESELIGFPNAAHDDQVDALSQYLSWVRDSAAFKPTLRRL